MKQLTCEMCGSTELIKKDGVFVCQSCGTKYSVEEAKKMMIQGNIDASGSTIKIDESRKLKNLYLLARRAKGENNAKDAAIYYRQIAIEEPNSWEAQFYKVLFTAKQCRIAEISNAALTVANCLENVFKLIALSDADGSGKSASAYAEVYEQTMDFSLLLLNNVVDHGNKYTDGIAALKFVEEHGKSIAVLQIRIGDLLKSINLLEEAKTCYKASEMYLTHNNADSELKQIIINRMKSVNPNYEPPVKKSGCYVATCVYGSYDCPEVWTLRRYRDRVLNKTWYGRLFIRFYYTISPIIVKWFGDMKWFKKICRNKLNQIVFNLNAVGIKSSFYEDSDV